VSNAGRDAYRKLAAQMERLGAPRMRWPAGAGTLRWRGGTPEATTPYRLTRKIPNPQRGWTRKRAARWYRRQERLGWAR